MRDDGDRPGRDPDSGTSRTSPDLAITTAEAAKVAGVSARTIRRWIEKGILPAVTGAGGVLYVFPADLEAARIASGSRPSPRARDAGDVRDVPDRDMTGTSSLSPDPGGEAAGAVLVAWRDTVLAPVVAELAATRREIGEVRQALGKAEAERDQVTRERDAAVAEVDRLRAAADAPELRQDGLHAVEPAEPRPGLWRRLRRLVRG